MARLNVTVRALDDLDRLVSFLQEAAPGTEAAALDAIIQALQVLARHPLIGRRLESGLRELVISRGASGYMALYDFDAANDAVDILRIRHQREVGYTD